MCFQYENAQPILHLSNLLLHNPPRLPRRNWRFGPDLDCAEAWTGSWHGGEFQNCHRPRWLWRSRPVDSGSVPEARRVSTRGGGGLLSGSRGCRGGEIQAARWQPVHRIVRLSQTVGTKTRRCRGPESALLSSGTVRSCSGGGQARVSGQTRGGGCARLPGH